MEPQIPSSSLRVLVRPSSSTAKPPPTAAPNPSSTPLTKPTTTASSNSTDLPLPTIPSSHPRSPDGVVVVGFIGRGEEEAVSQLMNRILDDNVFGSGNLDIGFPYSLLDVVGEVDVDDNGRVKKWFRSRRISYHYEEEKGIVFLQFLCARNSCMEGLEEIDVGLDLMLEEQEFGDLQGMLFMFSVTPHFPVVLATCPVVQFEASCLPPSVMDCEVQSKFSIGCGVILPPDSFVTLRLPFVYGVQVKDGSLQPLKPLEHQPEQSAWVMKGTVLQVLSKGSSLGEEFHS